jgi:2-phosphosulfolactate phosphatase
VTVSLEWGVSGARRLAGHCPYVVVVDVLSFSTTVSVATANGVTAWPHPWRDATAAARAAELGALLAGEREEAVSLSPVSIAALAPGSQVLLPSPNGASCCLAAAENGATVLAGCLRNAPAIGAWLGERAAAGVDVGVVPAGEQWPDGALRPSYEDWVGAGSIAALLGAGVALSAEAHAAALSAADRRPLTDVLSGVELVERGFAADVAMAEDYGADGAVPVLVTGRFVPASSS